MIFISKDSFWDVPAHVLVNPVNCVGVMGKGIAKEFKKRYPDMFDFYSRLCNNGCRPGECVTYELPRHKIFSGTSYVRYIELMYTKNSWRDKSRYVWVALGLETLRSHVTAMLLSYAFTPRLIVNLPAVGCGNGGLEFDVVGEMVTTLFHEDCLLKDSLHADIVDKVQVNLFPPRM